MTYLDPLFFCFLAMEKCCGIFFGGERGGRRGPRLCCKVGGDGQKKYLRWEGMMLDGGIWCLFLLFIF